VEKGRAGIQEGPVANPAGIAGRGELYLYYRQNGLWPQEVGGWNPETEREKFEPYMPTCNVDGDYPATILVHGTADTDVPYEQSVIMEQLLTEAGVEHEFLTIAEGGHGWGTWTKEQYLDARQKTLAFLRRHLL
jgi:dipeptidyl aminopeptidase/acylaminoacyl peptidase